MRIYIPTLGRADKQITLRSLPKSVLKDVVLVADRKDMPNRQIAAYQSNGMLVLECPERGIGKVRQWIVDNHNVKKHGKALLMLDDDLRFFKRRTDDRTKFLPATEQDVNDMLQTVENLSTEYAHGGILPREGGNRVLERLKWNTRNLRALYYDVTVLRKKKIRFDGLPVMEDFDAALQLLRAGYPSVTVCGFVQDQTRSNAPGGCSTYRTLDVQKQGALGLQKLHPEFVKTVEKTTKTAWGGATRTDVMVQWKKVYLSSQKG
jgi:hypothetical protein